MNTTTARSIAHDYFTRLWNDREDGALEDLVAPDAVGHIGQHTIAGHAALQARMADLDAVYTQPRFTVEDTVADGDKVAVRWVFTGIHSGEILGAAPTGRQVTTTGMSMFRIAGGKVAELWLNADDLGELRQLGVLPTP